LFSHALEAGIVGELGNGPHELKKIRMGEGESDQLADNFGQGPRWRRCAAGAHAFDQLREAFADEGDVKVFLAFEINIERALAHLCGGGDVIETNLVERFGREEACGGVGDFAAFDFGRTLHALSPKLTRQYCRGWEGVVKFATIPPMSL
jgi:hypothetical protein